MVDRHAVLAALAAHIGAARGISARDLAGQLGISPRHLRKRITELIEDEHIAVCGHPRTGYYVAEASDEIERTVDFHRGRALHELRKAARLSGMPLEDLVGQLRLKT